MRLILKSLKQVEYEIQVESNSITVKELKIEIEKLYSFDSEHLKLLFSGSVLDNAKKLSEYNIVENSTIIMMNAKIKKIENNSNDINKNNIEIKQDQNKQDISQILKDNLQITIDSLVEMGYEKSQVEIAVKAANGRIDLAVEYLNNGIPDNVINKNNNGNINRRNNIENEITKELKKQAGIIKALCKDNKYYIFVILENIKKNDPGLLRLITDYREEFRQYLDSPITEEEENIYKNIETKADEMIKKRLEEKEKKKKEKEDKLNNDKNKLQENKEDNNNNNEDKNNDNNNIEKDKDNNDRKEIDKEDKKENKKDDNKEDKKIERVENEKKEENMEEEVYNQDTNNKIDNNINKNNNNSNININDQLTEEDKQIINRLKDISGFPYDKVVEAFIVCNKNEELTANYLFEQYK